VRFGVRARSGLALLLCLGPAIGRAATIVVNDASDTLHASGCAVTGTGTCTLRDAITFANANPGPDRIEFAIGSGLATILLSAALPNITDQVAIDGTTQPGFAGSPLIELSGQSLVGSVDGITIAAGGCSVRGLVVNRFPGNGISLQGSGSLISGNYIGTDVFGGLPRGNSGHGISVSASGNTIGGPALADRNVISGNLGDGISFVLSGWGNLVQGNYIGTDRTGLAAIGNQNGIAVNALSGNVIGGSTTSPGTPPGNLISGNRSAGIQTLAFSGSDAAQTVILGNLIGTDATGASALGNQDGVLVSGATSNVIGGPSLGDRNVISGNVNGVHITNYGLHLSFDNVVEGNYIGTDILGTSSVGNTFYGVSLDSTFHNVIGGTQPGRGNLISGNGGSGVNIDFGLATVNQNRVVGNRIGTDASGILLLPNGAAGVRVLTGDNAIGEPGAGNTIAFNIGPGVLAFAGQGNAIRGNAIFSNDGLGIDNGTGVTLNDPCDLDFHQNFPVLTSATGGGLRTRVRGTLNSHPFETFVVDFYASSACDPSGYGEGQRFLGSTLVATDGDCNASFDVFLPAQTVMGEVVTATATDIFNSTSEFSACLPVEGLAFNTVEPCRVADTRTPESAPALVANLDRAFAVGGRCGIPLTAQAVAFNFAVTQPTNPGHLTVFPGGTTLPATSTLNYSAGQTRANNAVILLGASGDILVRATQGSGTVHLVIDVNGYFE